MLVIFPIGQESDEVRRVPWVTFVIMGLCVIIYLFNAGSINENTKKLFSIYGEIFYYYQAHPYLELNEELKQTFMITEEMEEILRSMGENKYGGGPTESQLEEEQAYLDNLMEELKYIKAIHPFFKWGFIPRKKAIGSFITSMFMHADWWHLLMNLLWLYILGPFIEDVWGKISYGVFYLVAGILAALAFSMHYPNSAVPVIGASGAIAGVMGGFIVRFWHNRIKYFYWIWLWFFIKFGTFLARSWVLLILGLVLQFINARIVDSIAPEGGGGVAYWAHVWGFIFGVAGAFLIKFLRIEEKFVAPKLEAVTTYVNKSAVLFDEARQVLAGGDKETAYNMLVEAARESPSNHEVIETLWNIAPDLGKTNEAAPVLGRLVEKEVQKGLLEEALFHFRHLRSQVPNARFSTHTKIKLWEQASTTKDINEAKPLFKELINEVTLASPPGLVLEFCIAAFKFDLNFDQSVASRVVELALQHPEIPEERKESLKGQLYAIPKQKKDAPIKVNIPTEADGNYDYDFSSLGSDVGGGSAASGAGGFVVPPVPIGPTVQTAPQEPLTTHEPTIPIESIPSRPPPIPIEPEIPPEPLEPTIPLSTQEPTIPTYSQPPPIPPETTIPIPIEPREPDILIITREPVIPMESLPSQPPPVPIEPVISLENREPIILLSPQEPSIPITPPYSQPPPIPPEPTIPIPIEPREPDIPVIIREPVIPVESTLFQSPPIPGTSTIPITPDESQVPFSPEPPPPPEPRKRLRVTKGVPLGVKGGKIALDIEKMGQRVFVLEKIKMVSVVKISPPGERPFLLIDLMVDDPTEPLDLAAGDVVIRILRLLSTDFNPQKFVAHTGGPLEAFKTFTSALYKLSGGKPFPDLESVQLKKVAGFRSISDYEDSLLNISA